MAEGRRKRIRSREEEWREVGRGGRRKMVGQKGRESKRERKGRKIIGPHGEGQWKGN